MKRFLARLFLALFVFCFGTCCAHIPKAAVDPETPEIPTRTPDIIRNLDFSFLDHLRTPTPPPLIEMPAENISVDPNAKNKIAIISLDVEVKDASARQWIREIEQADTEADLTLIEIHSVGGELPSGFLVSKAIERAHNQVMCVVDGNALSEAFYILQSCDKRFMTKRSRLMVHEPYYPALTNIGRTGLRQMLKELDGDVYAWTEHAGHKMKMGPDALRKRLADANQGDWYMTWKEALSEKAVDGVVESMPAVVKSLRDRRTVDAITTLEPEKKKK